MDIDLTKITIRELVKDYVDDPERGVSGYGGRLDIRPEYQREFVYKEKDRDAVIRTVIRGFPLNVMYWAKKQDGTFEVMDYKELVRYAIEARERAYAPYSEFCVGAALLCKLILKLLKKRKLYLI